MALNIFALFFYAKGTKGFCRRLASPEVVGSTASSLGFFGEAAIKPKVSAEDYPSLLLLRRKTDKQEILFLLNHFLS